jgi:hypothetical protein
LVPFFALLGRIQPLSGIKHLPMLVAIYLVMKPTAVKVGSAPRPFLQQSLSVVVVRLRREQSRNPTRTCCVPARHGRTPHELVHALVHRGWPPGAERHGRRWKKKGKNIG